MILLNLAEPVCAALNDSPEESELDAVEDKVATLGKRFFPSDAVFPLSECDKSVHVILVKVP